MCSPHKNYDDGLPLRRALALCICALLTRWTVKFSSAFSGAAVYCLPGQSLHLIRGTHDHFTFSSGTTPLLISSILTVPPVFRSYACNFIQASKSSRGYLARRLEMAPANHGGGGGFCELEYMRANLLYSNAYNFFVLRRRPSVRSIHMSVWVISPFLLCVYSACTRGFGGFSSWSATRRACRRRSWWGCG